MKISKDNNPEQWFDYNDDEKYQIKWLSSFAVKGLTDLSFLDDHLIDWEGVLNDNDEPIECNIKNKKAYASNFHTQKRILWMFRMALNTSGFTDIDSIKKK